MTGDRGAYLTAIGREACCFACTGARTPKAVPQPGDALIGASIVHRIRQLLFATQHPFCQHRLTGGSAAYIVDAPNPQVSRKVAHHVGWNPLVARIACAAQVSGSWLGNGTR
jgi:hypothetical protein